MDSVTQIVLGAAVGELCLGKKIGNKAQVLGAIAGTIPDLDVLLNNIFPDDLSKILIHRSYSHALLTHVFLSFGLAWLTFRGFKRKISYKEWYWMWFLCLSTHAILDAFTTYGTRLFLPFTDYQVGLNNISVIDPFYTFPFMFLLGKCLFRKRDDPARRKWALRSVYISSAYMVLTFFVKGYVHFKFNDALEKQSIKYEHLYTSPAFFSNALWAGMAVDDSFLHISEYSVFQKNGNIRFLSFPRHLELEKGFEGKGIETLKWFSQGKYILNLKDSNTLNVYIVKWGRSDFSKKDVQDAFIFYYEVNRNRPDEIKAIQPKLDGEIMSKALQQLWDRIWDDRVSSF